MDLHDAIAEVMWFTKVRGDCGDGYDWTGDHMADKTGCEVTEPIDHAIAAILNAVVSGDLVRKPKIKRLAWRDSFGVLRAETPFGDYKVTGKILYNLGGSAPQSVHGSTADAIAAAQADHEARLAACYE